LTGLGDFWVTFWELAGWGNGKVPIL